MTPQDTLLSISVLARTKANVPLELFRAIRERGCEVEDCRMLTATKC